MTNTPATEPVLATRLVGQKSYELKDHLGNVRTVITDRKTASGEVEVLTASNYYPFGMLQPGNSASSGDYRFGFNGKEMDNDLGHGTGNMYDYGFRIYNPRIAKFLSKDPLTKGYPMLTPYQFASNTPIWAKDLDGLEAIIYIRDPEYAAKIKDAVLNYEDAESIYKIAVEATWATLNESARLNNNYDNYLYAALQGEDDNHSGTRVIFEGEDLTIKPLPFYNGEEIQNNSLSPSRLIPNYLPSASASMPGQTRSFIFNKMFIPYLEIQTAIVSAGIGGLEALGVSSLGKGLLSAWAINSSKDAAIDLGYQFIYSGFNINDIDAFDISCNLIPGTFGKIIVSPLLQSNFDLTTSGFTSTLLGDNKIPYSAAIKQFGIGVFSETMGYQYDINIGALGNKRLNFIKDVASEGLEQGIQKIE